MATQVRLFEKRALNKAQGMCVLLACLLIPLGGWMFFAAAAQGHIRAAHGTVALLEGVYSVGSGRGARYVHGSRAGCGDGDFCGQYEYSIMATYEDPVEYRIYPSWFQPALPRWFAAEGKNVHFWYTSAPLVDSEIVAITIGDRTYLTDGYTHPLSHLLETAGLAAVLFAPGVALGWLGIFLPRIALRHPRLAEFFQLNRVPSQRHHKTPPARLARPVRRGVPKAIPRRARR